MEVKLGHMLEDMVGLFSVGSGVRKGDKVIVHIDYKPSFSDHVMERVIHELLECSISVTKTKEHDCWLKEPFVHDESHFPLMAIFAMDVVVAPLNVKLGEVASIF